MEHKLQSTLEIGKKNLLIKVNSVIEEETAYSTEQISCMVLLISREKKMHNFKAFSNNYLVLWILRSRSGWNCFSLYTHPYAISVCWMCPCGQSIDCVYWYGEGVTSQITRIPSMNTTPSCLWWMARHRVV